jgi:hypothetical protein
MVRSAHKIKWRTAVARPVRHFGFQRFRIFPVASPSRHLRLVADRRKHRTTPDAPNVGTVPPAHATDSPALQPLHSAPFQFRRLHFHSTAFRRPQTGETVRRQIVRARMMAGAASTGRETSSGQQAIAHESLLAGKASAIWPRDSVRPASNSPRGSARTRHGNNREHGHFPTAAFRWRSISPLGKMADLTDGGPNASWLV